MYWGFVFAPGDNVNFLALQFGNDGLDTNAAQTDAGSDGVNGHVIGFDGDFGFGAGVAGNGNNLDNTVINFRYFRGKQFGHKLRTSTGQENLRTLVFAANVENIGADAVAVFEFFPGDNFVAAQNGFGFADIENNVAELNPFDRTIDDGADFFFIFFELAVAFRFADFLSNNLFGGLGGNAAEVNRGRESMIKSPILALGS